MGILDMHCMEFGALHGSNRSVGRRNSWNVNAIDGVDSLSLDFGGFSFSRNQSRRFAIRISYAMACAISI